MRHANLSVDALGAKSANVAIKTDMLYKRIAITRFVSALCRYKIAKRATYANSIKKKISEVYMRSIDKGMLAWMIWASSIAAVVSVILAYSDVKQSTIDVKRGDTVHFSWTADNKFYSSNCTNYGTAIDQVGNKVFKVMILCTPIGGSNSFVPLMIHWYEITKVDQTMVLSKPADTDDEE